MSTWNNRVVVHHLDDEEYWTIHEAHYDEDKEKPHSVTKDPIPPSGDSLEQLKETLERMLKACDQPPLHYEDF